MAERSRTGGDVVAETLRALGARTVFGIPGQNALGLFAALDDAGLRLVASRVENNAAFAADGYARAGDGVGVLLLSTGPGALTALGALQEAWASSVPVVVVASQVPSRGVGGTRNGMLHQLDDQRSSAANVTKDQWLVRGAAQLPSVLAEAWSLARSAPAGPVWVEVPEDVLGGPTDVPAPVDVVSHPVPRPPRPEVVADVVARLDRAERPVLLAGGGVRRSAGAADALVHLAERLDAPVVSTVGGKGAIGFDHPLSAASWIEDRATTRLLEDADVLVAVGTSFGEVTSNYFTFAPHGTVVQVDADEIVLGSNHAVVGVHADAGLALEALADGVTPRGKGSGARTAAALRADVERRLAVQDLGAELALLRDLRAAVPSNAHTYWDMTIAAYWAWSVWDPADGAFHSAQGAGGLGFAFPAALGGAVASGRRTLAVSGDGGAMYSIAELATARQHDADITWLVVDDGGYGILREYMAERFGVATATELARPDFAALAESFGVSARVADLTGVGDAVAETFRTEGPAVVVLPAVLRMFAPTHTA